MKHEVIISTSLKSPTCGAFLTGIILLVIDPGLHRELTFLDSLSILIIIEGQSKSGNFV